VMAGAFDNERDVSKTRDDLLRNMRRNNLLVESKFEELVAKFKDRECMSCCDPFRDNEPDPRLCETWPMDHEYEGEVIDPPEPLENFLPNNVYAEGMTAEQIRMLKFLSRNMRHKSMQVEGYSADQLLRMEAQLILNDRKLVMDDAPEHLPEKKKYRGRKNRFFK